MSKENSMGEEEKMNKVSESIFSGKVGVETVVIPMADVSHVEEEDWGPPGKIRIAYTVHTKNGIAKLKHHMGARFMEAWCYYRHEIEGGAKAFNGTDEEAE